MKWDNTGNSSQISVINVKNSLFRKEENIQGFVLMVVNRKIF